MAGGTHHSYADKGGGFCVFNRRVFDWTWQRRIPVAFDHWRRWQNAAR